MATDERRLALASLLDLSERTRAGYPPGAETWYAVRDLARRVLEDWPDHPVDSDTAPQDAARGTLVHGCHGCGEEVYPVAVRGIWICPRCHSERIVCIEGAAND